MKHTIIAAATTTTTTPSGEHIWEWIIIAVVVGGLIGGIVKAMSLIDDRFVRQKQYDKDNNQRDKDLRETKERFLTDSSRHEKLLLALQELTQAILETKDHHRR